MPYGAWAPSGTACSRDNPLGGNTPDVVGSILGQRALEETPYQHRMVHSSWKQRSSFDRVHC